MSEIERNQFISKLYEDYFDRLTLFCMRMAGYRPELFPLVEECVQDVFYTAIKKHIILVDHPDVEGWLFRNCINHMNNMLKTYYGRKKRHAYSMDIDRVTELYDPNDSFRQLEEDEAYQEILSRICMLLRNNEKEIFNLYFLQGQNLDHISKYTGKSFSSIKSTIYRIRKRLKDSLFKDLIILLLIDASFLHMNK